jgi:serralysin
LWASSSSTDIAVLDTITHQNVPASAQAYSGPVAGLQHQYVYPGSDNVNISVSDDDWFLHGGSGNDAIAAHGGYNVLDGGTGSNFLTGGSGTDTFFVDDRGPPADIWSTVNGFHAGDDATVFGITPNPDNSNVQWFDNQGAVGYTGLTLHVPTPGQPTASLTLPSYAMSDLSNGRLAVQFGNQADSTPFMHIIANG